jgi:hypothetical protein
MPTDSPHPCKHGCGTMMHPFADTHRGERRVYWRETRETGHSADRCAAAARATIARLTAELAAYKRAKAENDERFMRERDEARAKAADATLAEHRAAGAYADARIELRTALSQLRRVRGWRVVCLAKNGVRMWTGTITDRRRAFEHRDYHRKNGSDAMVMRVFAKARG